MYILFQLAPHGQEGLDQHKLDLPAGSTRKPGKGAGAKQDGTPAEVQQRKIDKTLLKGAGKPKEVAEVVEFVTESDYRQQRLGVYG